VEGAKIAASAVTRVNNTIVGLLQSAPEVLTTDLQLMATVLQSTIGDVAPIKSQSSRYVLAHRRLLHYISAATARHLGRRRLPAHMRTDSSVEPPFFFPDLFGAA
jgi:hypothetical protein